MLSNRRPTPNTGSIFNPLSQSHDEGTPTPITIQAPEPEPEPVTQSQPTNQPPTEDQIRTNELDRIRNLLEHFPSRPECYKYSLKQSDFDQGTFRIVRPGVYTLTENISFNPNASTWNPRTSRLEGFDWNPSDYQKTERREYTGFQWKLGFFAAITVETTGVVIDLNGFTIGQSLPHYLQQRFFSVIELASAPFIPKQGPANFGNSIKSAEMVKICNGTIGLSSHHGIHGNDNTNVVLEDLNIQNYEQAGIALNGAVNVGIINVQVGKNSRNVFVNSRYSQGRAMRTKLKAYIAHLQATRQREPHIHIQGVTWSASSLLHQIETELDAVYYDVVVRRTKPTSEVFCNPRKDGLSDGAVYGILLNVHGVAVNDFIEGTTLQSRNKNITLENVTISNLSSAPREILGLPLDSSVPNPDSDNYGKAMQKGPVGDVFDIEFATGRSGFYRANCLANAQLYVAKHCPTEFKGTTSITPQTIQWATGNPAPYNLNKRVTGVDSMAHVFKGNVGLFLMGCTVASVRNVRIHGLYNHGGCGEIDRCDHPEYPYEGSRVRGVSVVCNKNLKMSDVSIDEICSENADSVGVDFVNNSYDVTLERVTCLDVIQGENIHGAIPPNVFPSSVDIRGKKNVTDLVIVK